MRPLVLLAGLVATPLAAAPSLGTWRNPQNSVHVEARPCGDKLCGTVIWASDKAKADAKNGGTDPLVGIQLFRDFVADGPDRWKGEVYVPDIGKTLSGTITQIDHKTLKGEGCLIGGFACKSQDWTRLTENRK